MTVLHARQEWRQLESAWSFSEKADHILCTEDLYGGTVRMFESIGEKRGLKFSYVDTSDIDLVRKNIRKETKALYIETPSNPTMRITDFAEMRKLADEFGLLILADNTFLSPYFQKPLQLGADIVVHSGTKFLGGHNDVLAGFVCVKGKELSEKLRYTYKTVGCSLSPFDSFLVLRGIKTLSVRLERQQENAKKIALWLKNRPEVTEVYYPGSGRSSGLRGEPEAGDRSRKYAFFPCRYGGTYKEDS